jgi:hypothetical protein
VCIHLQLTEVMFVTGGCSHFKIFSSIALERNKLLASRFSRLLLRNFDSVSGKIPSLLSDEKPSLSLSDNNASALIPNSPNYALSFSSSTPATKTLEKQLTILNLL